MFQLKNVLIRNVRCTMGRLHKKMDICSVMKARLDRTCRTERLARHAAGVGTRSAVGEFILS